MSRSGYGRSCTEFPSTLSGTTWTFGTGSAVAFFAALVDGHESTARTELGLTTIGDALATAATITAARATLGEVVTEQALAQTQNATTYLSSTYLTATLDANTTYVVDVFLIFDAPAVGFKCQLLIPSSFAAGASNMGGLIDRNGNAAVTIATSTSNTVVQIATFGAAATNGVMIGRLYIRTGASGGTAVIQFGQNNSTDAANPCTLKIGSTVIFTKLSP